MSYYEDCLAEIRQYIAADQNTLAYQRLCEELRMPYIPSDIEDEMRELLKSCQPIKQQVFLSDEQIVDYLNAEPAVQLQAIEQLSKRNIRPFLEEIRNLLASDLNQMVAISLIELLIDQQVDASFSFKQKNFNPSACVLPFHSPAVHLAIAWVEEIIAVKNPSMARLCNEAILKEAYLRLPDSIEETEVSAFANAIVLYVAKLLGCEAETKQMLLEKKVLQNSCYDLLLYSNNI